MRKGISVVGIIFLLAHLPFLPPTLEDIDSINFALGVRDFDVARHQPHPPGYPLFIALGKISTPLMRAAGVAAPEARGLAVWSAISGAALVLLLFPVFRILCGDDLTAGVATLVATFSPLFWFTALRPLSDMTGLAAAVAAQALIVPTIAGRRAPRALIAGALVAGMAIGIRSQTFLLTLPLLFMALVTPRTGLMMRDRLGALAAAVLGILVWAIPLVAANGGPEAYAAALGTQAGEDFSGVVMLWNMRTPRVALDALIYSFLWPWGHPVAGGIAVALAVFGAARATVGAPRLLIIVVIGFAPYAAFHLLFHEVVTVRYALPLVLPIALLATYAIAALSTAALRVTAVAAAAACVLFVIPATVTYARDGSPTFRALQVAASANGERVVGFHAVARRAVEWLGDGLHARVLKAPHGREWLTLVDQWRTSPGSTISFVADPRRTDLALFDARLRPSPIRYRWGFVEPPFVGGARPGDSDLYAMPPPGWMLERGWAVTPEVAGVTARERLGPHRRPSVAWLRRREGESLLLLGGRNLSTEPDAPDSRVTVTLAGELVDEIEARPGFFFRLIPLRVQGGTTYIPLEVQAHAADLSSREIPVALEQFDLQDDGVPMVGAQDGWHEPEYNPLTYKSWRWTSERAALWVRPVGRDVTLTISGESPLRYFDTAPQVVVSVGFLEVRRFSPTSDYSETFVLPAAALVQAAGRVTIASDKWFVPGEREGTQDRRHLALRIYSYAVK